MSPEFVRFKKALKEIVINHDFATDIQFMEDTHKSDGNNICMVLYCYYKDDDWEYRWFSFPRREETLATIEFHTFLDIMA